MNIPTKNRSSLLTKVMNLAVSYSGLSLNPDMEDVFHLEEGY